MRRNSDTNRYETFMSDANTGYNQAMLSLYVDGGGRDCGTGDQFAYYQTSGNSTTCSGVNAQVGRWYHVAVTRDSGGTRRFFVDGILVRTETASPAPSDSSGRLTLGRAGDHNGEYFPGLVDEVRISNISRYSTNFTPPTYLFTSDSNTVVLYHLDAGTGQTLLDSSGNGRNGTRGASTSSETSDPSWSTDSPITQ